ncbi:MAG TPA: hypothetical protein VGN37_09735 [Actinocatenispora sp.]
MSGRPAPAPDESAFVGHVARVTRATGGATADLAARCLVAPADVWYLPRYPGLTRIVAPRGLAGSLAGFLAEHRRLLMGGGLLLGTWINPETGSCYLDLITQAATRRAGVALARRYSREGGRRIIAICNPLRGTTERVWRRAVSPRLWSGAPAQPIGHDDAG